MLYINIGRLRIHRHGGVRGSAVARAQPEEHARNARVASLEVALWQGRSLWSKKEMLDSRV